MSLSLLFSSSIEPATVITAEFKTEPLTESSTKPSTKPTTKLTTESRAGRTRGAGGAPKIFVPITIQIRKYYEFITHEESEKRIILLGSIFALCLLTLATAFVLITIRLFGKYFQVTLNYKTEPSEIAGFPYPVTLMILHSGQIIEFSTISKKKNEKNGLPGLDKLPKNKKYNDEWSTNTFAFESQGYIFFLSTNNQQNVIKYSIYGQNHREISKSKIRNYHFDQLISPGNSGNNFKTHGVQIGGFYWIILGSNTCLPTLEMSKRWWVNNCPLNQDTGCFSRDFFFI